MRFCLTSALLLASGLAALAQSAPPQLPPEKTVPLEQALAGARAALVACAARGTEATVTVLDLNYLPKVLLSADGARTTSFEPARKKAYTVLKKGVSSGEFARSLGSPPVNTVIEGDPDLRASAGGLPISRGGAIIGALAVSSPAGQQVDEICAAAGIAQIRF